MTTETETGNAWENYMRGRDIRKFYGSGNQLVYTMKSHPNTTFRYIVHQQNGQSGKGQLNFNGSFTDPMQTAGQADAVSAVADTDQANLAGYFKEWVENEEELSLKYGQVGDYINERSAEDFVD